jgi:hypothetical protein
MRLEEERFFNDELLEKKYAAIHMAQQSKYDITSTLERLDKIIDLLNSLKEK